MKKKIIEAIIKPATIIICSLLMTGCYGDYNETINTPFCQLPPSDLTEIDFVGTWVANYSGLGTDTLIINESGTYQQIYSSKIVNVETDEENWWLERRPSGFIFLHFEGMHKCDGFESVCLRPSGGTDEETHNYCEGGLLIMTDEVILTVRGTDLPIPKGIQLLHTKLLGSDWIYSFRYQDE